MKLKTFLNIVSAALLAMGYTINANALTLSDLANQVQVDSWASASVLANGIWTTSYKENEEVTNYSSKSHTFDFFGTGYNAEFNTYYTYSASAKSYADLATGKVGANSYAIRPGVAYEDVYAVAYASFNDYVQFHVSGATSDTATTIPFTIAIDGTSNSGGSGSGITDVVIDAYFVDILGTSPNQLSYSYLENLFFYQGNYLGGAIRIDGIHGEQIPFNQYDINGSLIIYGSDPIWALGTSIYVEGNADFYNTAAFSFQLPENVTFESASGVFLTAAVPEPETYALLLAGLGMLGFMAKRRKSA